MNYVILAFLSLAFLILECLTGGTVLIFSLPVYALIGVAALASALALRKAPKIRPDPLCLISTGVFLAYILARTWFSPVEYLAREDFAMVLASLAVYLLTALYFVKSKFRMYFLSVLLVLAVGQVVVGLIQFTKGNNFMLFGYPWDAGMDPAGENPFFKVFLGFHRIDNGHRASGQYISPDHLAGYLEVVGIIGMSLVFWSTWRPGAKILAGYLSVVALGGVIITGSRGGYLSTAFCVIVFCVLGITVVKMAYPERLLRVMLIGLVVAGVIVGGAALFLNQSSLVKSRTAEILKPGMRVSLWEAGWQEFKIAPVTGGGSGTYLYYGRKFRDPAVVQTNDPVRVHNDYLDMLAEYGVVGMIGFLFFLVCHLRNGMHTFFWLVRKRLQFTADWRSSSLALNIGCLCAVGAYLVHSMVDFNLHIPANCMLMAFVFGILANPGLETSHEGKATAKTGRLFQFALPALGVCILVYVVPKIPGEWYAEEARVELRDGQYLVANLAATNGIKWEKKNPYLYYYLGEAERLFGDKFPTPALAASFYEASSDAFKQGIELFPEDENLLLIEGWVLDAMGRFDEADKYFQQAADWDPNGERVQASVKYHEQLRKAAPSPAPDSTPSP